MELKLRKDRIIYYKGDICKRIEALKLILFDDPEPCCHGVRQDEAFRKIDKIFKEFI